MKKTMLAAAALLAGCYSIEDVREQPVAWSWAYHVPYDTMANCLAAEWAQDYSVVPQIYNRERRAVVTLAYPAGNAVIAEYQVQQTDTETTVTWRHMGSRPGVMRLVDINARNRAHKCGAA